MRFSFLRWLQSVATRTLANGRKSRAKKSARRPEVRLDVQELEPRVVPSVLMNILGARNDSDGDGLSNAQERQGWTVTVTLVNGRQVHRHVTTNPNKADSDGDGL